MKNIHISPTEIPGRFSLKSNGEYCLSNYSYPDSPNFKNQNIYIISDEEIKKGDWVLWLSQNKIIKCEDSSLRDRQDMVKKIILTTDQNLINNGIEQISEDTLLKIVEHINSGKNIDSFDEL